MATATIRAFFEGWKDETKGRFYSWERNTEFGNDSDGGKVMRRERSLSLVKAFVSPAVLNAASEAAPADTIQLGDRGSEVSYLQKLLWDLKYTLDVDGIFGNATRAVVMQFQKDHFLEQTGVVSSEVLGAMQEELSITQQTEKKASTASYLQKGNSGSAVQALQRALNSAGVVPEITADGVFGEKTEAAVRHFQQSKGLLIDGVAGPKTFAALGILV